MSRLILLLAFVLHAQDKPPEKCAISGTVVDALTGKALNKVGVSMESATTLTDAKGRFSFTGLEPGQYFLQGSRNGYLDTYYGARRPGGGKTAIVLELGQDLKDVTLKLFPYSVVAGMVHDTDGEPLSGVSVTAWAVEFDADGKSFHQGEEMVTDDLGQFRIPNLEPGKYYLRAELNTGVLVDSFYPGVPEPDGATLVEVGLGARITGLNIAMPRPRAFTVTVHIAAPAGFSKWCELYSGRDEYRGPSYYDSIVTGRLPDRRPNDGCVFSRVATGSYTVRASASPPDSSTSYSASQRLEVTNGDIDDFRINLTAGAAVKAHYTVESDTKPEVEGGSLLFRGVGGVKFGEDQLLSTMLATGHYVVEFEDLPSGLYVKSMQTGTADVLREGLTVSGGGTIPLEMVLSDDVGALDGVVLDGDEKPVPGATLLLIPEAALRRRSDRFYTTTTDQYGRYHLKDLAPGDDKAIAWDDVKPGSWFDPEFLKPLESSPDSVTIQPKGHDTLKLHAQIAK